MASIARIARPALTPSIGACHRRVIGASCRAGSRYNAHAGGFRGFSASTSLPVKKYTKDHEWIDLSPGSNVGTIGISTYAAHSLGDVVYVELPQPGLEISAGDSIGSVESVKSASDIMTPVSGKTVKANSDLEAKPGLINQDPEGEKGWIVQIEVNDQGRKEFDGEELMGQEEYTKYTEE